MSNPRGCRRERLTRTIQKATKVVNTTIANNTIKKPPK